MLLGSVGTGKTTLIQSFFRDSASDSLLSSTINTSYYTDTADMQRQLEQPLDKVCRKLRRVVEDMEYIARTWHRKGVWLPTVRLWRYGRSMGRYAKDITSYPLVAKGGTVVAER